MTRTEIEAELEGQHAAGFAWALSCCGRRREEAEDVLQAAYLKILDGRASFESRSSFRTFLFAVIRRTAAEERRRTAVSRLLFGSGREEEAAAAGESEPAGRIAVRAALVRLSRRQREVLELVFAMGMTVREAADTLSISTGSARVHYDRGKKRLAALLARKTS
ncbi:MAG: RNA polymerase sigma factor [Acidobacteriota bacterium]